MSLLARPDVGEFRRRFRWMALVVVVIYCVLIGRLAQLQILDAEEYRAMARENVVRRTTLATTRGVIRDRNGKVLAKSRPAYNVYVVPRRLDDPATWARLVEYLGIGHEEQARLEARITALREGDPRRAEQQILLKEDVSRDVVAILETHRAELRSKDGKAVAVEVAPVPVRYYPFEDIGAHVLGYMAEVDAEKLTRLRSVGYLEGDRLGAAGVERSWESYLRGTRGWEKVIVDARGARRPGNEEQILEPPVRADPIPGRDVRLTLDADLQRAMVRAMRGKIAGAVAVVEVRTGRVLGLVSKPSYDPNALSGGSGKQVIRDAFRRLYSDPLKPMLDKTVAGAYPPGSTFKPFTALAALEGRLAHPRDETRCRGYFSFGKRFFRCTHVHGQVDLHQAIAESCNTYFYRLAAEAGVGMNRIADMAQRFGMGSKTGIGLNAEVSGRIPTRAWYAMRFKGQYRIGYAMNAALGQGETTVTVLQLALAYAALANGGTLYQPQIVRAVETSDGNVVQEFSPRVRRQVEVSPENLKLVQRALDAGVNAIGGTAYEYRLEGVDVAGKTGTAQVSHARATRNVDADRVWYFNRDHAWFAGYAPTSAPEIAVVVLVEHGGAGGKHAAPVAFEIVRDYQRLLAERKGPTKTAGVRSP